MKSHIFIAFLILISFSVSNFQLIQAQSSNKSTIGLVANWAFDNIQNNHVLDSSGNNLTGTLFNTNLVPGISGTGLHFNGYNSYMMVPDSPILHMSSISISLWYKATNANDTWSRLIGKGPDATETFGIYIHSGSHDAYDVEFPKSYLTVDGLDSGNQIWHHLVFVLNQTYEILYIDTIPYELNNLGHLLVNNTDPLTLGIEMHPGGFKYPLNGTIDEVSIYNRPLSSQEVTNLYLLYCANRATSKNACQTYPDNSSSTISSQTTTPTTPTTLTTPPTLDSTFRNIKIDGSTTDWKGINPSIDNSNSSINLHKQIREVFVANNNKYLFIRLDMVYAHTESGNYVANITLQNAKGTVFFAQAMYSTLSYNAPNSFYLNYGQSFKSDIVNPSGPFLVQSGSSSAGSIQSLNSSIDIVHLEIEIPISILLENNVVTNHTLQIKFWNFGPVASQEAGLVPYFINATTTLTQSNTINFLSNLSFVSILIGLVLILAIGSIAYFRIDKRKLVSKHDVSETLQHHQTEIEKSLLHNQLSCVKCGESIHAGDKFCQNCGTPILKL